MAEARRLLLADDSVTIQKVVDLTFGDEGMEVTTVSDGDQAIKRLAEMSPDIVLVDVHMPGRSGYEVCEYIKSDERLRHVPVMLLVGSFEPFDEAEARRVGADDYLTKPFQSIRQLVSKVGALLGQRPAPVQDLDIDDDQTLEQSEYRTVASEVFLTNAATEPLIRKLDEAQASMAASAAARDYGDLADDDQSIESISAGAYGQAMYSGNDSPTEPFLSGLESTAHAETTSADTNMGLGETLSDFSVNEAQQVGASLPIATSNFVGASESEESLLDLGDIEAPRRAAEADEFILDLQEEVVPVPAAVEPEVVPVEIVVLSEQVEEAQVIETIEIETSEVASDAGVDTAPVVPAATSDFAGAVQLSNETIDAIARRVVEMMSAKVVEEVAWQVVPELAELIIKRRLDEEKSKV